MMVDTCAEVWGGRTSTRHRSSRPAWSWARIVALADRLTLVEATALTRSSDVEDIRGALTTRLPDFVYNEYWEDIRNLPLRERRNVSQAPSAGFYASSAGRSFVGLWVNVITYSTCGR